MRDYQAEFEKRVTFIQSVLNQSNINDVTPLSEILDEIEQKMGTLPVYMGLDAGYHNAATAHLLESKEIRASSAIVAIHMQENITANGVSDTTPSSMHMCVPKDFRSTGEPPTDKATGNISATHRNVPNVRYAAHASGLQQREGWWNGMSGRMLWMTSRLSRKLRWAGRFASGARKQLNDHSRRANSTMASVCSHARPQEHARAVLPHRRGSEYEAPCKGFLFLSVSLLHAAMAVLPLAETRPLSMV